MPFCTRSLTSTLPSLIAVTLGLWLNWRNMNKHFDHNVWPISAALDRRNLFVYYENENSNVISNFIVLNTQVRTTYLYIIYDRWRSKVVRFINWIRSANWSMNHVHRGYLVRTSDDKLVTAINFLQIKAIAMNRFFFLLLLLPIILVLALCSQSSMQNTHARTVARSGSDNWLRLYDTFCTYRQLVFFIGTSVFLAHN